MKRWEEVSQIKVMLEEGKSVSAVARALNMDRKTVRKYREMSMETVIADRSPNKKRRRKLDGFEEHLQKRLEAMMAEGMVNAQAIYEELKLKGFKGSARSVRRYLEHQRKKVEKKRIYQPFETEPGAQAMVDLGEKRNVTINGTKKVLYFIAMVLSYSRRKFVAWYDRPIDTEMFLEFHEAAFTAFGGIPQEIVYDQTKLAVISETYGEVAFNERFHRYIQWRGAKPYVCRKADPETKGKVEAVVRYVKHHFLLGKSFTSIEALRTSWDEWLEQVGDAKIHETTGRIPKQAWEEEKPYLQPIEAQKPTFSPAFREGMVHKDGFIKVLGNRYSVPHTHHGRRVQVRVTETTVEIRTLDKQPLWTHGRCLEKGKRIKVRSHYEKGPKECTANLTQKLVDVVGNPLFADRLKSQFPRHYRDQCQQILKLEEAVGAALLKKACLLTLEHDCISYQNVRDLVNGLSKETSEAVPAVLPPGTQMRLDMGLETRSAAYYDRVEGENA